VFPASLCLSLLSLSSTPLLLAVEESSHRQLHLSLLAQTGLMYVHCLFLLELIAIPPPSPSWPKWVLKKKKNIISLSLRDQGSANTELFFLLKLKRRGGGKEKPKIKTGNFKNYSVATKSFIVSLIKDQQTRLSFLLLRLLQGEKQNKTKPKKKNHSASGWFAI
jgi:hypothetical protein